jgi:hypothetical protein
MPKTDQKGRTLSAGMQPRRRRNSIAEQFIAHTRAMRESPAWRALPDNARRLLDLLELEHMRHGGCENGRLGLTYGQFKLGGIRRASVPLAIRQCERLGFLEVTLRGYRAAGGFHVSSIYRLTYVHGADVKIDGPPTDEWSRIADDEYAAKALAEAEGIPFSRARKRVRTGRENATQVDASPGRENATHVLDAKTRLTSISPGGEPQPQPPDTLATSTVASVPPSPSIAESPSPGAHPHRSDAIEDADGLTFDDGARQILESTPKAKNGATAAAPGTLAKSPIAAIVIPDDWRDRSWPFLRQFAKRFPHLRARSRLLVKRDVVDAIEAELANQRREAGT